MTHYIIRCKYEKLDYWSNVYGWTQNKYDCSVFTEDERKHSSLPLEGEWVKVNVEVLD
jgi:hypothetical protein